MYFVANQGTQRPVYKLVARQRPHPVEFGRDDQRRIMCIVVGIDPHNRFRESGRNQALNFTRFHNFVSAACVAFWGREV